MSEDKQIILVCGGRDYTKHRKVEAVLDPIKDNVGVVIEGGAPGLDTCVRRWCIQNGVHYATVPALWDTYKKAAGPKRNWAMSLLKPDKCIAFPGGRGTENMVSVCNRQGIPVDIMEE